MLVENGDITLAEIQSGLARSGKTFAFCGLNSIAFATLLVALRAETTSMARLNGIGLADAQ